MMKRNQECFFPDKSSMISCDLEGVSKSSSWPSLIGISLLLPLLLTLVLSQQKKERREIRVGKAMVVDKRPAANQEKEILMRRLLG